MTAGLFWFPYKELFAVFRFLMLFLLTTEVEERLEKSVVIHVQRRHGALFGQRQLLWQVGRIRSHSQLHQVVAADELEHCLLHVAAVASRKYLSFRQNSEKNYVPVSDPEFQPKYFLRFR
jgi:hypothetical protein